MVNCLPALRLLKKAFPESYVTWAAEEPSAGLLKGDPDIDEVFVVKRREWTSGILNLSNLAGFVGAFAGLRRKNFDIAIDFQCNLRSGIVTFCSGARIRIGFTPGRVKEHSHVFYTKHANLPKTPMHRVKKNMLLLKALGVEPELLPAGLAPDTDGASVMDFLKKKRILSKRIVTIHPGVSKFGAYKQWRPEGFAEVARRLANDKNTAVIITWGPGERALADDVTSRAGSGVFLGPKPKGLKDLAYLLKRSELFVGCDTGPLHMAAAVGTSAVAIFGPKDPAVYGPVGEGHIVVRKDIECSPCDKRTCPEPRCMEMITADEVYNACKNILS